MSKSVLQNHIEHTLGSSITDEDFNTFCGLTFEKSFDKKQFFVEPGSPCNYQYFILEGSCYSYYVNEKGDKNAIQLAIENHWITDSSSFFTNKPAVSTIETLEPTRVLLLSKENLNKLCKTSPIFDRYFRILLQNAMSALYQRIAKTNSEDAEYRYKEFSKLYPHFVQRIPQFLIASYLGVKPQSLSRIRREMLLKD